MKFLLLYLFIYIHPLLFAQTNWQETGVTACGPVLLKLHTNPENKFAGSYELKMNGTPGEACVVKLRSYFATASGEEVSSDAELTSAGQWQQQQALQPSDSVESFIRTQLLSSTNCTCAGEGAQSGAGGTAAPGTAATATAVPAATAPAPDSATATPAAGSLYPTETPAGKTPVLVGEPADSSFVGKWSTEPHPSWQAAAKEEQQAPAVNEVAAVPQEAVKQEPEAPLQQLPDTAAAATQVAVQTPAAPAAPEPPAEFPASEEVAAAGQETPGKQEPDLPQQPSAPDTAAAAAWAAKPAAPAGRPDSLALAAPTTAAAADSSAGAAPLPAARSVEVAVAAPGTAAPDSAWVANWSMESGNRGAVVDSAALEAAPLDSAQLATAGVELEEKVLTAEELDSIRIYNDPFILENMLVVADAQVRLESDKLNRPVMASVREQLDLLEEKQLIFMEKYTKLVKTGNYSLTPCSVCGGHPIIHRTDNYPPYEACSECKGGGYKLAYHGDAKPNTIKHLYFAELLPAPDYRRPTLKRVSEGPLDFEYENGIFKTDVEVLSATKSPYFFACVYYKGYGDKPNRMAITEIINKNDYYLFAGADKTGVMQLLDAYLPEPNRHPDAIYLWEFNTFEDAYNRSIIPLHRAGVVGFEVDVIKYEIPDSPPATEEETEKAKE